MALSDDVTALETAANTVVTAVETVKADVDAETTQTEDPAWTAVKEALTSNGWTAPEAPETPGEPTDSEDTAEVSAS